MPFRHQLVNQRTDIHLVWQRPVGKDDG
jgi:hypothetical protein